MIKKIALSTLALAGLYLGLGALVRFCATDETKIRALVADMMEAYNEGKPGSCVAPLAKDWRHEGYSIDRQQLLGGLFEAARDRERETRLLRSKVEVDEDAVQVSVNGERATLATEATFWRLRAGNWEVAWRLALEAELVDGDGGWEIVVSRHRDLQGTQLGR